MTTMSWADLGVWSETATEGEYLAEYEDDDLDEVSDPGSRCGYDDATLTQTRSWLGERGLSLSADDRGLCVVALERDPDQQCREHGCARWRCDESHS
jgi:hypothetical protein